jgi:hypothetical protein
MNDMEKHRMNKRTRRLGFCKEQDVQKFRDQVCLSSDKVQAILIHHCLRYLGYKGQWNGGYKNYETMDAVKCST